MKEVRLEFRYDKPVQEVFDLVASGSFQVEVTEHTGGKNVKLTEEASTPSGKRITVSQQTGVELPGFAKKLIPANTTVIQTYDWSGPDGAGNYTGTWAAVTKGAPITIGGPSALESTPDGGTIQRFGGQVRCSVPLVGGKLEQFAMDNLTRELTRSHEFTQSRL